MDIGHSGSDLPRLWLVERVPVEQFEIKPHLELPESNVRVFANLFRGAQDYETRRMGSDLLQQICASNLRLACSCNPDGHLRPEIMCKTRPGGRSFSMAKMPSSTKRPEHLTSCPFSRNAALDIDKVRRVNRSAFDYSGQFSLPVDRLESEQASGGTSDRQRPPAQLPNLTRMFAALLGEAGVSHLVAEEDTASKTGLIDQLDRIERAARTFKVSQSISLDNVLIDSLYPKQFQVFEKRLQAQYEKHGADQPRKGFVLLYTTHAGTRYLRGPSGDVELRTDVQMLPNSDIDDYQDSPSLSLVFYGAPDDHNKIEPLQACVFPVYGGQLLTPIANNQARQTLRALLGLRLRMQSRLPHIKVDIQIPLERVVLAMTDQPDFIMTALNSKTDEEKTVFVLVDDDRHKREAIDRDHYISQWRDVAGRSVFLVDDMSLAGVADFKDAVESCLRT